MTGYAMYRKIQLSFNVGVDDWDDIGDDQAVWESLAEKLALAEDCT